MDFVTSVCGSLAGEAAKYSANAAKLKMGYIFNHESKVENLQNQIVKLTGVRDRLQTSVDAAVRNGELIFNDVENWLNSVHERMTEGSERLKEDKEKAKKRCFIGLCPNFKSRYQLSKKAEEEASAISELLGEADRMMSRVSYRPDPQWIGGVGVSHHGDPQGIEVTSIRGFQAFESRTVVLEGIMEALKDPNVRTIGVYGMGGVGKTMLVSEIARKAKEENVFEEVAIATISNPLKTNLRNIQGEIADALGLKFDEETDSGRAKRLRQRLNSGKSILVVLDDIWAKLDLEAVGISFDDDQSLAFGGGGKAIGSVMRNIVSVVEAGCILQNTDRNAFKKISSVRCKILLTSRNQHVLCNSMNTQKNFHVTTLSKTEGMDLFARIVGDKVEKTGYGPIAVDVVEKCAGLPVAISIIANALKNMDLDIWEDALRQLKRSNPINIEGMDEGVYKSIELSYKFLGSKEAQLIFLLCGLEFQGSDILISELIRCSWGLDLLEDVNTLEEARKNVNALVHKLKASCLLLSGDNHGAVKMHDIVHDVCISIASKDMQMFVVEDEACIEKFLRKGKLKDCTAISLSKNDVGDLPEALECLKLELLLFFSKSLLLKIPEAFFKELNMLKVLHLTGMNLKPLPSSFLCLTNLRSLCLDNCSLQDITVIVELKNLEILSFSSSDIDHLPIEIARLTRLRLLDLSNCTKLKVIPANLISKLSNLEELYMSNSFDQWKVEGNTSLDELKCLLFLTALDIHVRDGQIMQTDLFSEKLQRYRIFIGEVWDWSGKYEASRTLKLKINTSVHYLDYGIKRLLKKTEDLYLDEVKGVTNVHELDEAGFQQLKYLHIQNGSTIRYVMNSLQGVSCEAFPNLEALYLRNLMNLEMICHGQLKAESFSRLRIIKVTRCGRMKNLLSFSIARDLCQLQEIEINDCENITEIVVEDSKEETGDRIEFGKVRSLILERLPKLVSFSSGETDHSISQEGHSSNKSSFIPLFDEKIVFPCLEDLQLCFVNSEKIWQNQNFATSYCIQNLTSLVIKSCDNFDHLLSTSMARGLKQLRRLEVKECESMKEVIVSDEIEEDIEGNISFPKLIFLSLIDLPELTRFCQGNFVEFTSLKEMWIKSCPALIAFIFNATSIENLHASVQALFNEKVTFPKLEKLVVYNMEGLRRIWDNQLAPDSFHKLNHFMVAYCDRLQNIFPFNMLERVQRLGMLEVLNCDSVEDIFECQGPDSSQLSAVTTTQSTMKETDINLVLSRLTYLKLYMLPKLKSFYPSICSTEWPLLKKMLVNGCNQVEIFVLEYLSFGRRHTENSQLEIPTQQPLFWVHKHTFPSLEELRLEGNVNMKEIWKGELLSECFWNLKVLDLKCFPEQSATFARCFFQSLPKLSVRNASLKEIFQYKDPGVNDSDNLVIWDDQADVGPVFQNLRTLVVECSKLKSFMSSSVSFPILMTLEVSRCHGLKYLLTHSVAKSLVRLTRLSITECKKIKGIISPGEDGVRGAVCLVKLKYLELLHLPKLKRFCKGNIALEFPSLDELIVRRCPELMIFCQGALSTPKLERLQLIKGQDGGHWAGDLNTTIEQMYKKEDGFPELGYLSLSDFFELAKVWKRSPQVTLDFESITFMELCDSSRMGYLFTPSMAMCLVQLRHMKVKNCTKIEQVIKDEGKEGKDKVIFPLLNCIVLESCSNLASFCMGTYTLECPSLKNIITIDCPEMLTLASTILKEQENETADEGHEDRLSKGVPEPFFSDKIACPTLEWVNISHLKKLKMLWHKHFPGNYFCELQEMQVTLCEKLLTIFPSNALGMCKRLKKLKVSKCYSLEEVFEIQGLNFHETHAIATQLRELHVCHLPKLKHVWNKDPQRNIPDCFKNVTSLMVKSCDSLKYVIPYPMVKSFLQLKKLFICNCSIMERIVERLAEEEMMGKLLFPKLEILTLEKLPKLTTFCTGDVIEFLSLKELQINNCPVLKTFVSNSTSFHITDKEAVRRNSNLEENLHNDRQHLFDEKVALPMLEKLEIFRMESMRSIWQGRLALGSFHRLNHLRVGQCPNIVNIFPMNMLGRLETLDMLEIFNCYSLKEIFESQEPNAGESTAEMEIMLVLPSVTCLLLFMLPNLKTFGPRIYVTEWPSLRKLLVFGCNQVEIAFASRTIEESQLQSLFPQPLFYVHENTFPSLEKLRLEWNSNLKDIMQGQLPSKCFPNLKVLELIQFPDESTSFPHCFFRWSPNLEKLEVSHASFEEIFQCEGPTGEKEQAILPFAQLSELKLSKLPKLSQLWDEKSEPGSLFQNLVTLEVLGCSKLKNIVPSSVSLPNLVTLDVSSCHGLINLITHSTAKSLLQLKRLRMMDCKMVERIIAPVAEELNDCITFNQLEHLELISLPRLECFCLGDFTLQFCYLDKLIVTNCPKLKIFYQGALTTPMLETVIEGEHMRHWAGDLNTTIQQIYKKWA